MSPIYAPTMRGDSDAKLLSKIDKRIAAMEEIVNYALGSATEVAAAGDELRVLQWAKAGAGLFADSESPRITAVPLLKRLREQRDELADVLRWLDRLGGLGLDVHERIRKALEGVPSYEQQLRNVAEGIGMSYDELIGRFSAER